MNEHFNFIDIKDFLKFVCYLSLMIQWIVSNLLTFILKTWEYDFQAVGTIQANFSIDK